VLSLLTPEIFRREEYDLRVIQDEFDRVEDIADLTFLNELVSSIIFVSDMVLVQFMYVSFNLTGNH
jgi:hypothetical protein